MCNQMIRREITIMMYARHPTIIKFIGYSKEDFHEENNVTVIMELAKNGSLKDVLKKIQEGCGPKDFTNTSRQIIIAGVARGMKFLHDRSIIHRDLKTDNILLDDDFHPHITDFGLSKFIESGHTRSQTKFGGTLPYEAPEILQGVEYDQKVDVYSFGILLFEILTDSVPYPELEQKETVGIDFINKIVYKNYRPKFKVPVKKSFKKLIEKCWSKNPDERPTFGEIFTILTKKNNEENEEEDFMLNDVDNEEFNLYVEEITEITDGTEKLLSQISQMESEIKKLKSENKKLKKDLEETNDLKSENEQLKKDLEETKNLKSENKKLKKDLEETKNLKSENEQLKKDLEETKNLKSENKKLKKDLKEANDLKSENEQLKKDLEEANDLKSEIKRLKEENQNIIAKHDEELKKLPIKETRALNNAKKQFTQSIIVCGSNECNGLGGKSNNKNDGDKSIISPPMKTSFDPSSILSSSNYRDHSVLVMNDGSLKGIGRNYDGRISATLQKTDIKDFTDFCIKDTNGSQLAAVSAVCYSHGTLYMFSKSSGNDERQLVLCDCDIKGGDPVFLDIGNHHPVSLFSGFKNTASIGSEGEVIFINRDSVIKSPNSPIEAVSLPEGEKASSVACFDDSVVVLSSNGRVFTSPINSNGVLKFSIVSDLSDEEIACVSGTNMHILAVNKEGRVPHQHRHKDKQPKVDNQNVHYSAIEFEKEEEESFSSSDTSHEILILRERMKNLENSFTQNLNEENDEISLDESDSSSVGQFVELTSKIKNKLNELDNKITEFCVCDTTRRIQMIIDQALDDASGTTTANASSNPD